MTDSICIVNPGDISTPRGGESRVIAFAKSLSDHGFDVHLVVPEPKKDIPKELRDIKIHTVPVYSKGGNLKSQFFKAVYLSKKAKKVIKENKAILQLEHSPFAGFATFMGCSKFVLDMHDLAWLDPTYSKYIGVRRFVGIFEKKGIIQADEIIVVSEPMRKLILSNLSVNDEDIYVVQNGYFEEKFTKFNLNSLCEIEKTACFLGTLHRKIDIYKIIYLAKSIDDIKIYVVGEGPARQQLQEMVRKHNLNDNIIIKGWLPDNEAYRLLAVSQVAIYPCKRSLHTIVSAPVRILDYAAMRKAMVLDDISECEIWKEFKKKKAAMFSNPYDPDDFVRCVQILLEDDKLRHHMGLKAKKIAKNYTWDRLGRKLVKLYISKIIS